MHGLDSTVTVFINSYAHKSSLFDLFMHLVMDSGLLKGGFFMAILWWVWFKGGEHEFRFRYDREVVMATIVGALFAVLCAKFIEFAMPHHPRPMNDPLLHFQIPYGVPQGEVDWWEGHSSFPSDHAAMFFALAAGLFYASRKLGWVALIYTVILIAIPRLYNGAHYFSDLLAGALIGIVAGRVVNIFSLRKWLARP